MNVIRWSVPVDSLSTRAEYEAADSSDAPVFVCAHGAGGNMDDRGIRQVSAAMRNAGLGVVRFNFLYSQRKSRRPDPVPRAVECFAAVAEHVRRELGPRTLIIGGRSYGGRVASIMAADAFGCDGLLLLAYPLHPPGQPEKLRDAHLRDIRVPVLCFNGTRDPFCTRELMDDVLTRVETRWTMHWIEGADHGFRVLKSTGRTDADVMNEVRDSTRLWLEARG